MKEPLRDIPRVIPLVTVWDWNLISQRAKLEAECGVGVGNVLPPMQYCSPDSIDEEVGKTAGPKSTIFSESLKVNSFITIINYNHFYLYTIMRSYNYIFICDIKKR